MRIIVCLTAFLAFSQGGFAQGHGGSGGNWVAQPRISVRSNNFNSGFGSILYPGTGRPPTTPSSTFPFVGSNPGGIRPPFQNPRGHGDGHGGHAGSPLFYPVPIFVGGDYTNDASAYVDPNAAQPQPAQMPNITIVMPPQQQAPAPEPSTATQGGAITTYRPPEEQQSEPPLTDQVLFFIALKDASVYTAAAYWVEDGTLHYITPQGRHNQVSLDLVDRETSARLNQGRKVDFRLPAAR